MVYRNVNIENERLELSVWKRKRLKKKGYAFLKGEGKMEITQIGNLVYLIVVIALIIYLTYVLFNPKKF